MSWIAWITWRERSTNATTRSGLVAVALPVLLALLAALILGAPNPVFAQEEAGAQEEPANQEPADEPAPAEPEPDESATADDAGGDELAPEERLVVVWTSGDRDVALKMVFMYTYNARRLGWWEDVTLLVWGPSAKLLSEDAELQEYVGRMAELGIHLEACKACADMYGVGPKLEELGITVHYTGQALTDYIKQGRHVITF